MDYPHRLKRILVEYGASVHPRKGMTLQDIEAAYDASKGMCAICGIDRQPRRRNLALDHDHRTGRIRGILCSSCNTGLGMFKDEPELLRSAAMYLDAHSKNSKALSSKENSNHLT